MVGGCIRLYLRSQGGRCTWLPGGTPGGAAGALLLVDGASGTSLAAADMLRCSALLACVKATGKLRRPKALQREGPTTQCYTRRRCQDPGRPAVHACWVHRHVGAACRRCRQAAAGRAQAPQEPTTMGRVTAACYNRRLGKR